MESPVEVPYKNQSIKVSHRPRVVRCVAQATPGRLRAFDALEPLAAKLPRYERRCACTSVVPALCLPLSLSQPGAVGPRCGRRRRSLLELLHDLRYSTYYLPNKPSQSLTPVRPWQGILAFTARLFRWAPVGRVVYFLESLARAFARSAKSIVTQNPGSQGRSDRGNLTRKVYASRRQPPV